MPIKVLINTDMQSAARMIRFKRNLISRPRIVFSFHYDTVVVARLDGGGLVDASQVVTTSIFQRRIDRVLMTTCLPRYDTRI